MSKEINFSGLKWVYITRPSSEEITKVSEGFPFHPLVMESIVAPTLHPLVEDYENHLFLILHFPVIIKAWRPNQIIEVDFLITNNTLITITYTEFQNFEEVFQEVQQNEKIQKKISSQSTGLLLYHIIDQLFQRSTKDISFIEEQISKIEDEIFEKRDYSIVETISQARRDILDFQKPLWSQSTVLKLLAEKAEKFYGKNLKPYFADLLTTEERIKDFIDSRKETIDVLHQTNESLMSSHISRIISVLTIFSAIILPLSLIASIWGMNHRLMPLRDNPYDFWIVMGLMAIIAVALLLIFKKKRWL